MGVEIQEFDAVRITNFSIKYKGETAATEFGGVGQLQGETTLTTVTKNVEGIPAKTKSNPQSMQLTINAHINVDTGRKIFGLSNANLKPGVYSYGADSKGGVFVLTADVIDEFEDVTKLIAFTNCSSTTGLMMNIENGADEVAELELKFDALLDDNRQIYYEAFADDLDDTTKSQWHTNFTPDLVTATSTGTDTTGTDTTSTTS